MRETKRTAKGCSTSQEEGKFLGGRGLETQAASLSLFLAPRARFAPRDARYRAIRVTVTIVCGGERSRGGGSQVGAGDRGRGGGSGRKKGGSAAGPSLLSLFFCSSLSSATKTLTELACTIRSMRRMSLAPLPGTSCWQALPGPSGPWHRVHPTRQETASVSACFDCLSRPRARLEP